ncbi:MAG: hypothetical protein ACLQBB_05775 [Solirubrobacteraceae bacterium]
MSAASEGLPAGVSGVPVPRTPGPTEEAPAVRRERGSRALSVAARLLAGATTFFFLAFVFAYFYLRSLNVEHMWRPAHVKPDQGLGAAFAACLVVSVVLTLLADRSQRASRPWVPAAGGAVLLGLAAIAIQCIEYTTQKFGPTDGAFASVFCAWSAFYLLAVLGTMYWLETQVATELRERREPAAKGSEGVSVYEHPDRLLPRGLDAAAFYWAYLGAIGLLTYIVLYLLQS